MTRRTHVVGTVDGTCEQAMRLLVDELADTLATMPDGEGQRPSGRPGRPNWVIEMLEERADRPEFRQWRRSRMSEPRPLRLLLDPPRCVPARGHKLTPASLHLPYAKDAAESYVIFRSLSRLPATTRPQYGIPDPRNVAGFFWANPLRHYDTEVAAAQDEISAIMRITDGRAVFQWEGPLQLVAVAKMPRRLQGVVAGNMARAACEFIAGCAPGCTWVLHPCWGNKHDTPSANPPDVGPLVELVNAMIAYWPTDQHLDAIHLPFGNRLHPVPVSVRYYWPLSDLDVPAAVHLSAGLVRPEMSVTHTCKALLVASKMADRGDLGVSTPCGWSRQPGQSLATARILREVAGRAL